MSTDPFERHGIDHLSPSSLRLFRECLPVWTGKYLLHAADEMGPGAWRGQAVEAGVDRLLFGETGDAPVLAMHAKWNEQAQGLVEPDCVKEQEALDSFYLSAAAAFTGQPVPLQRQGRIELDLPGISVPLVGYCDWRWSTHGDDLKTTWRMPNGGQPDPAHVDQVTCYSMHYGVPFFLTYVTPKRWTRYEVTGSMAATAWDRVIETAQALRSFLEHVRDGHDALSMMSPDYTSYFFRPAMTEAVRASKALRVLSR
jgi:hypothetical protein